MFLHLSFSFFFNYPPTSAIYTLSLHDALPISIISKVNFNKFPVIWLSVHGKRPIQELNDVVDTQLKQQIETIRSEEHTSELQSRPHLVCRLLLEKKKKKQIYKPAN